MALVIDATHHPAGSGSKGIERQARASEELRGDENAQNPNAHDRDPNTLDPRAETDTTRTGGARGPEAVVETPTWPCRGSGLFS